MATKAKDGVKVSGGSLLATFQLYKRGFSPEQIAQERELSPQTIYAHLIELYQKGEPVRIFDFVKKATIQTILQTADSLPEPLTLKSIFEKLEEKIPYHEIRFALAFREREGKEV